MTTQNRSTQRKEDFEKIEKLEAQVRFLKFMLRLMFHSLRESSYWNYSEEERGQDLTAAADGLGI